MDNSDSPLLFAGFDTLQGGTGDNTFEVNATFDGTLNGGGTSGALLLLGPHLRY